MAVEWTRLSGEAIEELVAVLLCRRFPNATLVRPSKGDGGIDILVPNPSGGLDVYQVKKFSSNLTSSQKGQIVKSFRRLNAYRKESGLDVREWHLTLPLNPTKENLAWLGELTKDAGYPCDWRGLNFVEGLAAEFPEVVDYYMHDGADRLATAIAQMTQAMGLKPKDDGSGQVTPAQLADYLHAMQPLLDSDPHFRYGISLDPQMPELPDDTGLIVAVSSSKGTDATSPVVTVKVFPRFDAALQFRPIPLNVTLRAAPGTQFAEDLQSFHKFGTPLEAPSGSVDVTADLPGGLGGSWDGGSIRIGPSLPAGPGYQLRLAAVAPDRAIEAEVLVNMAPVAVGLDKTGAWAHGTDEDDVFDVELLSDLDTQHMKFHMSTHDMTGRRPVELLGSMRFLMALRPPNELAIAQPYGPIVGNGLPLPADADWLDEAEIRVQLLILETLAAIQNYTTVQLVVPPAEAVSAESIDAWITARRLLEGEVVEMASAEFEIHVNPGADVPAGQFAIAITSECSVRIGDQVVELGDQLTHCVSAAVVSKSIKQHDDHLDAKIQSAKGSPVTIRLQRSVA